MFQFLQGVVLAFAAATAQVGSTDALTACKSTSTTYEEAVRVCTAVVDDAKSSVDQKYEALLLRAHRSFSEADGYERALADLAAAIALKPGDPRAFVSRGQRYNAHFAFDKAVADFTAALQLQPGLKAALVNRAYSYLELKNPDGAIKDYDEILRSSPDDAETLASRGGAYESKGDIDRARADYNRAIGLKREIAQNFPAKCFGMPTPWGNQAPLQLVNWPACQEED